MPKDFARGRRVGEQIQRELAEIVRLEMKDPRIGLITFTGVEVTPDLAHAKVYFTLLGDADKQAEVRAALQHGAGFLRSQLAQRLKLRTMPQLHFQYDESVERGMRLSRLIDEAVGGHSQDE